MIITREFTFDAAHRLPHVPEGHKCGRLHGHTYQFTVAVDGEIDPEMGWVMDFGDLKQAVAPTVDLLDHQCLNDIPGLENPTSELLAMWIYRRIAEHLPGVVSVTVHETPSTGCTYGPVLRQPE